MAKKNETKNCRLGKVGGQAVLEGIMMRSGEKLALAVRTDDGKIKIKNSTFTSIRKKHKILNIPILRGFVNMIEMFKMSYGTLSDSADMLGIDETEDETKFEKWLRKVCGDNLMNIIMGVAMVLAVALSVGLFVFLPNFAATGINALYSHLTNGADMASFLQNVISGVIRITIFVVYMYLTSLLKDIRRTFEYHGAEHKTIACYESGMELTVENSRKCSRFHARCGTSFIFVMLIISILLTAFINWNTWPKIAIMLTKLAMLPVIAGVGFEFLMFAGKHPGKITNILSAPGLWMQRITTKEPDDSQLEVAILAIKHAMPEEFPDINEECENVEIINDEEKKEETDKDTEENCEA